MTCSPICARSPSTNSTRLPSQPRTSLRTSARARPGRVESSAVSSTAGISVPCGTVVGRCRITVARYIRTPDEVVAEIVSLGPDAEGLSVGQRVVLNPWLTCAPRGVDPPCPGAHFRGRIAVARAAG